jgi:homoserine O-acetyltransferase
VIWICHALTANANAQQWWEGLVGAGKIFDPAQYYIVCANMLGSCYGTTGPASINPDTNKPYGRDFPLITVRDMAHAHELLRIHLGIEQIKMILGGSMGGQQALEWMAIKPQIFEHAVILATNAQHSPWGIAFNEAQRMAIMADPTIEENGENAGKAGLEAARAIAILSYRNYQTYHDSQSEKATEKLDDFLASSYQRYQGQKLQRRFNVWSYLTLSKAMDSHNLGRGRGGVQEALKRITTKTLIIGIASDVLFPIAEQAFIARHLPNAHLEIIDSLYGHDGFLIEHQAIAQLVAPLLNGQKLSTPTQNYQRLKRFHTIARGRVQAMPGTERF